MSCSLVGTLPSIRRRISSTSLRFTCCPSSCHAACWSGGSSYSCLASPSDSPRSVAVGRANNTGKQRGRNTTDYCLETFRRIWKKRVDFSDAASCLCQMKTIGVDQLSALHSSFLTSNWKCCREKPANISGDVGQRVLTPLSECRTLIWSMVMTSPVYFGHLK